MLRYPIVLGLLTFVQTLPNPQFNFNAGPVTGMGCIVTRSMLFSQGNFIRTLKKEESDQFKKYKKELAAFKNKIADAFDKAEETEAKNATIPPMPVRPTLPSFCNGPDTTVYIFGACSVQNNKLYVGKVYARDLEEKEKHRLAEFIRKMGTLAPGATPPADIHKGLDFCTEL